jgi:gas vesicle protein
METHMYNEHQVGGGSVMLAFVIGALSGAAVALLFAPASGEETREYLGQKAREGRARARDAVEQGREMYQRQRETLTSAVERGREAFQQARERGEQQA